MKFEFSAGGIVVKREKNQVLILIAQHSQHHGWVFPKGLIGDTVKGESKEATALREVEEETGVKGKIIKPITPVTYWYVWSRESGSRFAGEKEKRKKTVYYFIMEYISGDITNHDNEMESVEWLPFSEVEKRLTYKTDKEAWKQAKSLLLETLNSNI